MPEGTLVRKSIYLFVFCSLLLGTAQGSKWSRTGNLNTGRMGFMTSLLPDGRVMVMGGDGATTSYEIFDPATGSWTSGSLPAAGTHTIGMLLPNGKVLYIDWVSSSNCGKLWLYNPQTASWTGSKSLGWWGQRSCATLLKTGEVILNYNGQSNFFYNYSTDDTAKTGMCNGGLYQAAAEVLLGSGKVLMSGGTQGEIYNPATETWGWAPPFNTEHWYHVAVLLPSPWSKVLIAGGETSGKKCELSSPSSFSYTGDLNYAPRIVPALALLPSGDVLLAGSQDDGIAFKCELYNPDAEQWVVTDTMQWKRSHFSLIILPTGKVLAAGSKQQIAECEIYDPSDGDWSSQSFITVRGAHTVTPLPIVHTMNCSTNVLIAGGENSGGALASCELYNYREEVSASTCPFTTARTHHTALLLPSGNVLAAGGENAGGALNSCELYDVNTETWATTGNLQTARFDHTATLLRDGRVFVTGGESGSSLNSCELYSSGSWTPTTSSMNTPRARHMAVLLLSGKVLVIGGENSGSALNSCELWDPSTGNWTNTGSLNTARYWHTAVLLQSGKVLVMGGRNSGGALSSCEIYNPSSGTWTAESNLNSARYLHNSTLLYSGIILVTGGYNGTSYLSSCELWDPGVLNPTAGTHEWKVTKSLGTERAYHSSVLVPGISPYLLIFGGTNGGYLSSMELYDIGLGYRPEWQSTITNYPAITPVSSSMHIDGTLFRGLSEADGGNGCHIVSNDHPIMSFVRIGGGNFQSNGGGDILYMPLSSSWDSAHTDVSLSISDVGYYRLWAIVNGIPSKWYEGCTAGTEENSNIKNQNVKMQIGQNPFKGTTVISYYIPAQIAVSLKVYDISGKLVRILANETKNTGNYGVKLETQDLTGGVYFAKLDAGSCTITKKLVLLK